MVQTHVMLARIGADDVEMFSSPRPGLLREITGLTPRDPGDHVLLKPLGVRSTQRLALADVGGGLVAAMWPAELKTQATYLYGFGLGTPMVTAARERGWTVVPSPHIAFFNSTPAQRLYMSPTLDASEYVRRWERDDLPFVRQYATAEVRATLWPWLKERGYASANDDGTLDEYMFRTLKKHPAHLRPALRLKRRWHPDEVRALGAGIAGTIRADVDAILHAADEPPLRVPATWKRPVGVNDPDVELLHQQQQPSPLRN